MSTASSVVLSIATESTGVSRTRTFEFLGLPRELRDMVYRYLVPSKTSIQPSLQMQEWEYEKADMDTALLRVNRQIYSEALQMLYANNTINLRVCIIYRHPMERLLWSLPRGQFLIDIFAQVTTLHVKLSWFLSDNWTPTTLHSSQADSGWYSRSDVEQLKAKVNSMLKVLSQERPDKSKTLILEFPPLVYTPNHKLQHSLKYVVDTGLADLLRDISQLRTLQIRLGRYRSFEYSYLVYRGVPRGMFAVYESSLELGMDLLINGRGTVEADAERASVAVRAEIDRRGKELRDG